MDLSLPRLSTGEMTNSCVAVITSSTIYYFQIATPCNVCLIIYDIHYWKTLICCYFTKNVNHFQSGSPC